MTVCPILREDLTYAFARAKFSRYLVFPYENLLFVVTFMGSFYGSSLWEILMGHPGKLGHFGTHQKRAENFWLAHMKLRVPQRTQKHNLPQLKHLSTPLVLRRFYDLL